MALVNRICVQNKQAKMQYNFYSVWMQISFYIF